jgi:glycosyltransferase involved in cell wall biosynthesis
MPENKILSIIITCHNQHSYLIELLGLIDFYRDEFENTEFIIVDSSYTIFDKKSDVDFKMFRVENKGPSYARNFGVSHAIGNWVLFCDADDFFNPYLEKFAKLKGDCEMRDAYFFPFKRVDDNVFQKEVDFCWNEGLKLELIEIKSPVFFIQYFYPVHSVLLNRKIFDNVSFDEECWLVEDVRFYLNMQHLNVRLFEVVNSDNYLSYHRDFQDRISLSRSNDKAFWNSVYDNYLKVIENSLGLGDRLKLLYLTACNYHVVSKRELKLVSIAKLSVIWNWYWGLFKLLRVNLIYRIVALVIVNRKLRFNN